MQELELLKEQLDRIEILLSTQKEILTFDEVCTYTGMSRSHLYKLTSTGKIPHSKPTGKLIFFDRIELESWLKKNRIKTSEELEQEASSYCTLNEKGGAR